MLQLTYDAGDILEYTDPYCSYTLLIESVDGSTLEFNGYPYTTTILTNMTKGEKLRIILPKYLGRTGSVVLNKLA